jgi:hypothetical protein
MAVSEASAAGRVPQLCHVVIETHDGRTLKGAVRAWVERYCGTECLLTLEGRGKLEPDGILSIREEGLTW